MENENVSQKSSSSNALTWVILAVLVIATFVGVYFILRIVLGSDQKVDKGSEKVSEETSQTEEKNNGEDVVEEGTGEGEENGTGEECTQSAAPSGWQAIESPYLSYVAYRPGWYFRIFGGGATLGLDPKPIPENSEYAGMITISKRSGSVDSQVSSFTSQLEAGYTETAVTAGCREWKIVEGKVPANEIFDEKQAKAGFTTAGGAVFQVLYQVSADTFATHEAKFDTLIDVMVFKD